MTVCTLQHACNHAAMAAAQGAHWAEVSALCSLDDFLQDLVAGNVQGVDGVHAALALFVAEALLLNLRTVLGQEFCPGLLLLAAHIADGLNTKFLVHWTVLLVHARG